MSTDVPESGRDVVLHFPGSGILGPLDDEGGACELPSRQMLDTILIEPARPGYECKIVWDDRESRSHLPSLLESVVRSDGTHILIDLEKRRLSIGDYVLSDRLGIERKNIKKDLFNTLFDRREFFSQIGDLARAYSHPVLLLEGDYNDLFSRNVDPAAIYGLIKAVTIGFRVPIWLARDAHESARMLAVAALSEQSGSIKRPISLHGKRSHMTDHQLSEYIVSSVLDVGPTLAQNMLRKFGSVREVFSASVDEIEKVERMGHVSATNFVKIVNKPYTK